MKNFSRVFAAWLGAILIFWCGYAVGVSKMGTVPTAQVYYSLDAKQNDARLIEVIDGAENYIYFAIYTFTKQNIADALIRAKRRGVEVRGITDLAQSQILEQASLLETLREARIPVETQKHAEGIMHMKLLVTDKAYAVGSYNWTWSATNVNDEVLEIGTDEALRGRYEEVVKKVIEANR